VEVLNGLSAGEQVIVQGINRVRPGSLVTVVDTRPVGRVSG
jgi:hypothetical protein